MGLGISNDNLYLGLLMHFIQTSNMGSDKTSVGFTFEIPNTLSEEQREE